MRAARFLDKVGHSHAMGGLITGALVGAGLVIGGALLAGASLFAAPLIGAVILAAAAGAGIGECLGSLSYSGAKVKSGISWLFGGGVAEFADWLFDLSDFTGFISTGSSDVYINSQNAARVGIDIVPCRRSPH